MANGYRGIRASDAIRLIVLVIALCVLLYPAVSGFLRKIESSRSIVSYDTQIQDLSGEGLELMRRAAIEYNQRLTVTSIANDPFSGVDAQTVNSRYQDVLDVDGSGMMGYVLIPKIAVELPIYHGTSEKVLQKGVGHMEGTSLPVGGESTHTVLTGHRGLPTAELFTGLDKLQEGDVFYIKALGETLSYRVDSVLTVLPAQMDSLRIEEGGDYATLVTCTPYAVNTHRLLIRGVRIPYDQAFNIAADGPLKPGLSAMEIIAITCVLTALIIFIAVTVVKRGKDRLKRRYVLNYEKINSQ